MSLHPGQSTLGDFLQTLRASRRLGLSAAAQAAGVHRSTLHRWEQGDTLPRLSELEALLSVLKADPNQKRQALLRLDAPRGKTQVREDIVRIGEHLGIGSMPHGGDLLRALRMRRGLSLDEAASRIQITGGTLRRWEKMEVWPSLEQLHRLCYTLGAQEEEILALTVGRFAQIWGDKENVTLESLQQRLEDISASRFALMQSQLIELSLLTLEAQLWALAARSAGGRRLLAQVYTLHAHILSDQERFAEMGQHADRALAIAPEKSTREEFWLRARIFSAHAESNRGSVSGNRRSIERFRQLLPFARTPDQESWILTSLGELLVEDGAIESGLFLIDQACRVAERCENPIYRRLHENDKARILLKIQRPAEALNIIATAPDDNVYFLTGQLLEQAEAYLDMGKPSEAHDHLDQAYHQIEAHNLHHFRSHADALAQRL
jgi:transcriptional regulator with XRE-family HTH domain